MTQQQVQIFLQLLNGVAEYVPPHKMALIASSDAARHLAAIAQGEATCAVTPTAKPEAPAAESAKAQGAN